MRHLSNPLTSPLAKLLLICVALSSSMVTPAAAGQNCATDYKQASHTAYRNGVVDDLVGATLGLVVMPSWGISAFAALSWGSASAIYYHTGYRESKMASLLAEAQAGDGTDLRVAYGQAKADGCPLSFDQFKSWLIAWSNQQKGLCNNGQVTNATVNFIVNEAAKAHSESTATAAASQTGQSGAKAN